MEMIEGHNKNDKIGKKSLFEAVCSLIVTIFGTGNIINNNLIFNSFNFVQLETLFEQFDNFYQFPTGIYTLT